MLSATALKNRDSGHTNTSRVLGEGTDKRDKNYRRYRSFEMRNNETGKDCAVREVMTDKVQGRTLYICKQHEKREGKKKQPLHHL